MDDYNENKPISPLGYIGYELLYAIPVVGLICAIIFAISAKNQNKKNFARAQLIAILIGVIILAVLMAIGVAMGIPIEEMARRLSLM